VRGESERRSEEVGSKKWGDRNGHRQKKLKKYTLL
jgi:hypothetical protein